MASYIGSTLCKDFYIGSTKLKELYCGSTLIYKSKIDPGQVILESSTATTSTIFIPSTQNYEVTMVGGGAGGTCCSDNADSWYKIGQSSGGSGGYIKAIVKLQKGIYNYSVGAGGAGAYAWIGTATGGAGGDTYLVKSSNDILKAGGASLAKSIWGGDSFRYVQSLGGTNTTSDSVVSVLANTAGEDGQARADFWYDYPGGASRFGGYGKGGRAYSYAQVHDNGVAGYIKIVTA